MAPNPWDSDRPLGHDTVRRIIRAQFPAVRAETAEKIGYGWDFDSYEIDGQWVFRFPRRREYDARLLTELALLDEIAGTGPIPMPVYEFRGRPCGDFPYHFGGYRKLEGREAWTVNLSPSAAARAACELGEFLDCLHRCDSPRVMGLDLYGPADEGSDERDRRETLETLEKLGGAVDRPVYDACRAALAETTHVPAAWDGPLRVCHGDLLPQHILVDDGTGRVRGIIDWSDAAFSDPRGDFVGLWMWLGRASAVSAIAHYRLPLGGNILARIRYRALCVLIGELHYARLHGQDQWADFCLAALRRELGVG